MQPWHVDLRGLTVAEAEAKVREQSDMAHEKWLVDYEIAMIDLGADADELVALVAGCRAELARLREQAIEDMRAMVARGGKGLQ